MAGILRRALFQQLQPAIRQLNTSAMLLEAQRQSGVCKWFSASKGFGFITPDDQGPDVFVHQTNIIVEQDAFRSLRDGEAVEFMLEEGPDGRTRAVQVTGPGGASPLGAAPRARFEGPGSRYDSGGNRFGGDRGARSGRRDEYDDSF